MNIISAFKCCIVFLGIGLSILAKPHACFAYGFSGGEAGVQLKTGDSSEASFQLHGVFIDMNTLKPEPGVEVTIVNRSNNETHILITDEKGSFQCTLAPSSAYFISGQKSHFFDAKPIGISTFKRDPSEPFNIKVPIKRMELNVLYRLNISFPINGYMLYSEMADELDYLLNYVMRRNAGIVIEIGVHTDARGDDDYNLKLSQKRAESIVEFFTKSGISKDRVVAKGYGESRLINACGNGVRCSATLHAQNRRVEFRILRFE